MTKEEKRKKRWNAYWLSYYYKHRDAIRKKKKEQHYKRKDKGELTLLKERTKRNLALMSAVISQKNRKDLE